LSAINAEVDSAVRSLFTVKDYFVAEEGAAEYSVAYQADSGEKFLRLLERLKAPDYSAQLYGDPDHATLSVLRNPPPEPHKEAIQLSTPSFLFLLTILSLLATGYVVGSVFPSISPGAQAFEMGAAFVAALTFLFVARYFVHRYMSERGMFSFVSYYLPNVPLFIALPTLYFLPTFGGVSFPVSPPSNRNKLFDFYLAGALIMVAVAAVLALLSAGTSVVLTHAQYLAISSGNQTATIQTNPSLIQAAAISLASPHVPPGGMLIFSPVEIAAWIALLFAFLNLIPAGLFDGGRMSLLAVGSRGTRVTSVVAGGLLLLTDLPDYWVVFLLVFLMAAFPVQGDTLDSITELSRSRRALFVLAVLLGLLCVPVPQSFATFGL